MGRKKNVTLTRKRLIIVGVLSTLLFSSCQAVRTITTTAETKQIGDTCVIIQTKTTESYVGKKQ